MLKRQVYLAIGHGHTIGSAIGSDIQETGIFDRTMNFPLAIVGRRKDMTLLIVFHQVQILVIGKQGHPRHSSVTVIQGVRKRFIHHKGPIHHAIVRVITTDGQLIAPGIAGGYVDPFLVNGHGLLAIITIRFNNDLLTTDTKSRVEG